jgi:hypothetical protein
MHIRLTNTSAALAKRYAGNLPLYRKFIEAAQSGRIPARQEGSVWVVEEEDLPTIAEFFGLVPITEQSAEAA